MLAVVVVAREKRYREPGWVVTRTPSRLQGCANMYSGRFLRWIVQRRAGICECSLGTTRVDQYVVGEPPIVQGHSLLPEAGVMVTGGK